MIIESGLVILDKNQINANQVLIAAEVSKLIISLYDITSKSNLEKDKIIASKCLNIWDKMYEYNIGIARLLTNQMMNV